MKTLKNQLVFASIMFFMTLIMMYNTTLQENKPFIDFDDEKLNLLLCGASIVVIAGSYICYYIYLIYKFKRGNYKI